MKLSPLMRPSSQTVERVSELLRRMTLAEKVGQLVQWSNWHKRPQECRRMIQTGEIGSLLGACTAPVANQLQRIAVEKSRLGIPLLIANDVIHGYRTIFPIPLGESCTWNPELLERTARAAAAEAASEGTSWIYAPMVDVPRDPRWGRVAESAGEDPYLTAELGRARVRGFQSHRLPGDWRVAACPKHFVAYGGVEAGRDYNRVEASENELRDRHLPPFRACLEEGAATLMTAFNEINGIPASIFPLTMRTILRQEWGFDGVVISDYNALGELVIHQVARDLRDAAGKACDAQVDIDMCANAYNRHLAELVESGTVPMHRIDRAVARVLRLKLGLGLFENPYVDESLSDRLLLNSDHRTLALEAACQSMVLLKNRDDILPLQRRFHKIAVVGPLADDRQELLGCWHCKGDPDDVPSSILGALREAAGADVQITYAKGCETTGPDNARIGDAVTAARNADVVVAVLGEPQHYSGEAQCRTKLDLPGRQQELLDAIREIGRPVVTVILAGRPLVLDAVERASDAILMAWHPGTMGGLAAADILLGQADPSGRLTMCFPRHEGQIPVYYGRRKTGRPVEGEGTAQFEEPFKSRYLDNPVDPLYSFGHGLTYTKFAYRNLQVTTPEIARDGLLRVAVELTNTGHRAGAEVVQLYTHDCLASLTRPRKELKAFQRVELAAGESRLVEFEVPASRLGFTNATMEYVVEPGEFRLWVGPDSVEGLEGTFEVSE